jgi:hypothetical protein
LLTQDLDVMTLLQIPPMTLIMYLTLLERHYPSNNPYHNNIHATDVAQSISVMLHRPALRVRHETAGKRK